MCELFLQYSRSGSINEQTLAKLLTEAIEKGACRNSDGFGIFNEKGDIFKTDEQLGWKHYKTISALFEDSKWIVLHLRMATTGSVKEQNAHPFEHNGNVLAHNGVTYPPTEYEDDRPDSYHILREIHQQKEGNTVKGIQDAMSKISGSVSIFLKDYKGKLYYFRDGKPFTFAYKPETEEILGATVGRRLSDMESDEEGELDFFSSKMTKQPKEGRIFKIDDSGIHTTDTFDMADAYYGGATGSVYNGRRGRYKAPSKNDSDFREEEWDDGYKDRKNGKVIKESDYEKWKAKVQELEDKGYIEEDHYHSANEPQSCELDDSDGSLAEMDENRERLDALPRPEASLEPDNTQNPETGLKQLFEGGEEE